jgi:hypothetical protein
MGKVVFEEDQNPTDIEADMKITKDSGEAEGPSPLMLAALFSRNSKTCKEFSDNLIFLEFVRKVYTMLFAQLFVTFAFCMLCAFEEPLKIWIWRNLALLWVCVGILSVLIVIFACFPLFIHDPIGKWVCFVLIVKNPSLFQLNC